MATEATITVPSETFPLGTVFETLPGVVVELERLVPDVDALVPYFWVRGVATDDIKAAFSEHQGVKSIRLIDNVEDEYLLRVEWSQDYVGLLTIFDETDVVLISAVGTNEQWTFNIRGDTSDNIEEFLRLCRNKDLPITLTALHALTPVETPSKNALTDPQQELLESAYEMGYFEIPRETNQAGLAEQKEVSDTAVSQQLRRGMATVLEETLVDK